MDPDVLAAVALFRAGVRWWFKTRRGDRIVDKVADFTEIKAFGKQTFDIAAGVHPVRDGQPGILGFDHEGSQPHAGLSEIHETGLRMRLPFPW